MAKKVIAIEGNKARVIIGEKVKSKRRGKGWGTGKDNRQSSQDRPARHR